MKCEQIQRRIAEAEPPFPDDLARHLADCAECRAFADADLRVRAWMRMKARETAGPGAEERVARNVRLAITATRPAPPWQLWLWETALPWVARAAAAAMIVAAIGVLWRTTSRPSLEPFPTVSQKSFDAPEVVLAPTGFFPHGRLALQPEPVTNPVHPMIRLAPRSGMEYGTAGLRLVNWEK